MLHIRVPATSANIGPGFDTLGLALQMYNEFIVAPPSRQGAVEIAGCAPEFATSDNLFVTAYRRALKSMGLEFRGISLQIKAAIPIARGLGSSAAMIAGGIAAAVLAKGDTFEWDSLPAGDMGKKIMVPLAAHIEGHPDNVTPAIYGGFCAAVTRAMKCGRTEECGDACNASARVFVSKFPVDTTLIFHALIPPFALSTQKAREALPLSLPYKDAVFNVGRAAMVTSAFASRNYGLLHGVLEDTLHQQYRAPLIPGYQEITQACQNSCAIAYWLSGAGPTIMALTAAGGDSELFQKKIMPVLTTRPEGAWHHIAMHADNEGLRAFTPARGDPC